MEVVWTPINWLAVSMLMIILEIIAPAYLFLGFAIGAGAVAVVVAFLPDSGSVIHPMADMSVILAWTVMSLIGWCGLRLIYGKRRRSIAGHQDINDFENRG